MQSQPDILTRLWTAAQSMFARLRASLGEAAALAARAHLGPDEARAARKWLHPLEAMVRKTVLVHALALIERGDALTRRPRARTAEAQLTSRADKRAHLPATAAAPPALTLIALAPPPVRILTHVTAVAATAPRPRAPSLRLWPRASASAGPRARDLGPALLVAHMQRDAARLAVSRQMRALRTRRRSEPQRLARRIDAIAAILARPLAAARRLARTLAGRPRLAILIAARRAPRTRLYPESEYALAHDHALNRAYDWTMRPLRDTS